MQHRSILAAIAASAAALTLAACSETPSTPQASSSTGKIGSIPGLSQSAVDVMNSPPYRFATWAVRVTDPANGDVLVDYNSSSFLEPASVTKTYSVGSAWLKFGPDSRIDTPVVRQGAIRGRTLDGNLILVAKGDILMGGQTGKDDRVVFENMDHNDANVLPGATIGKNNPLAGLDKLAQQIRQAGIRRITGDVIVDDRLFITQDLGINDGPVSPIIINNNLIDLVVTPKAVGKPAGVTMRPVVAPWTVDNRVTTVKAGGTTAIAIDSSRYGRITLTGTIAADSAPQLKVEHFTDPPRFARTAFIEALDRAGVSVPGSPTRPNPASQLPPSRRVARLPQVAVLTGLPLAENATYILKVSYNRGAQTQVCLLAVSAGSRNCEDGFPEMAKILSAAGVDPKQASFIDGSGLPGNFVTADSSAQLMAMFSKRPDADRWQQALPIMGVDGSIATVNTDSPAKGQVYAKTGTLGDADYLNGRLRLETKALGGYVIAKSGRKLAISIIVNQAMFDDIEGVFAANNDLGDIAASIYEDY